MSEKNTLILNMSLIKDAIQKTLQRTAEQLRDGPCHGGKHALKSENAR